MAEERMLSDEILLGLIKANGGGGGTNDYNDLLNQPSINNTTLKGDMSAEDLGLATEQALSGKQDALTAGDYIQFDGNEISVNRSIAVNTVRRYVFRGSESTRYIDTYLDDELVSTVSMYFTESTRNFNDEISVGYDGTSKWLITNLKASTTKPQGYVEQRSFYDSSEYTQSFEIELHAGDKLVIKSEMDTALANKQDALTFDDVPTDGSNNPVKSDGIYDALSGKQDIFERISYANWQLLSPQQQAAKPYYIYDYPSSQITAGNVSYSNTTSGMSANNVQGAVDELKSGLTNLGKHEVLTIPANTYNTYALALAALNTAYSALNADQKRTCYLVINDQQILINSSIPYGQFSRTFLVKSGNDYGIGYDVVALANEKYIYATLYNADQGVGDITENAQSNKLALYY